MANPENLARNGGPDLFAEEELKPLKWESFENLKRLMTQAVAPVRFYQKGEQPDYSDKSTYFPPVPKSQPVEKYGHDFGITGEYIGLDQTLDKVGTVRRRKKGEKELTRERVRQIVEGKTWQTRRAMSQEIRTTFLTDFIGFSKPRTLASKQRNSIAAGGKSVEIAGMLDRGESLESIKKRFSVTQIATARTILEGWGYNLQRDRNPVLPRFEDLQNPDATDEIIQALLDKITSLDHYRILIKNDLIRNLTSVAKKAGLHLAGPELYTVVDSLQRKKMPAGKFIRKKKNGEIIGHFHFIAAIDEAEAINILKNDPKLADLKINPVKLVAGPEGKTPTTSELLHRKGFDNVGNLVRKIMGKTINFKSKIRTSDILKGSSVPVWLYNNSYFYPKDREEELRTFLEPRLRELGLM